MMNKVADLKQSIAHGLPCTLTLVRNTINRKEKIGATERALRQRGKQ